MLFGGSNHVEKGGNLLNVPGSHHVDLGSDSMVSAGGHAVQMGGKSAGAEVRELNEEEIREMKG